MGCIKNRLSEGGPGSGNFGHAGRPGLQGGSAPGPTGGAGKYNSAEYGKGKEYKKLEKAHNFAMGKAKIRQRLVDLSPRENEVYLKSLGKWKERYAKNPPRLRGNVEKRIGSAQGTALLKGVVNLKFSPEKTARGEKHLGRLSAMKKSLLKK